MYKPEAEPAHRGRRDARVDATLERREDRLELLGRDRRAPVVHRERERTVATADVASPLSGWQAPQPRSSERHVVPAAYTIDEGAQERAPPIFFIEVSFERVLDRRIR
jgi:hypothetical protein